VEKHAGGLSQDALVGAILEFLADQDLLAQHDVRAALEREIRSAGPQALLALKDRLVADNGWGFYPPDPLARRIHHLLADSFLGVGSELRGARVLPTLAAAPVVIVANHLSYADANVIEVLLQRSGGGEMAGRLTALAGPKVFTSRIRRFSSLCFGTIKVPQSAEVASDEAVLDARDVARAARQAIGVARERLRTGDALLLFGEGTRSRTGKMQSMLPAVARYLDEPGTWILPAGLAGPESMFPVDGSGLRPARLVVQLGQPIRAGALIERTSRDRRLMMDTVGLAVAALPPPGSRGVYGDATRFPDAARVLRDVMEGSGPGASGI
jgi:1-acyl-sn-glycerol-3-phosphate acyltransferase